MPIRPVDQQFNEQRVRFFPMYYSIEDRNVVAPGTFGSTKSTEMADADHDTESSEAVSGDGKWMTKLYLLSEPLAAVLGLKSMSRPEIVKQLWVYIKENDLQNPQNRRMVRCDPALRTVFLVEEIDMFRMNKILTQHLFEME